MSEHTDAERKNPYPEIDLKRGLLFQVHKLGDKYPQWAESALSCKYRLFDSDFFEFFSITPWYMIPLIWLPVSALLGYHALACEPPPVGGSEGFGAQQSFNATTPLSTKSFWDAHLCFSRAANPITSMTTFLSLWIVGVLAWTFVEYQLHQRMFHIPVNTKSAISITFQFLMHGQHHKFPMDPGRLVFPPVAAAILATVIGYPIILLGSSAPHHTYALLSGMFFGYVAYDLTHYYLHHGKPSLGFYQRLRARHMVHHFYDESVGFGLSSSLWDYILHTLPAPELTKKYLKVK